MLSCVLSYIASILFANVNFTHVYARKNYTTVEIKPKGLYFKRSMPPFVTKPLVMMDVIHSLDLVTIR